ncbi:uncharacterized protein G2W53_037020 [Senna tora]|uniref:Uncharacterized protein n=1 Tax=Senna tora TaxID=362788 RepID=A0A834W5P5_9FABA|nr:uncharacterized protein G2W53_037020 [Senna tora]
MVPPRRFLKEADPYIILPI